MGAVDGLGGCWGMYGLKTGGGAFPFGPAFIIGGGLARGDASFGTGSGGAFGAIDGRGGGGGGTQSGGGRSGGGGDFPRRTFFLLSLPMAVL